MQGSKQEAKRAVDAGLRSGATPKGVWALAWPGILANVIGTIVMLIQVRIIRDFGPDAIAIINTGVRLFFLMQAMMMALGVAATALVARAWGAGDHERAEELAGATFTVAIAMATVITVVIIVWRAPLAAFFDLDPAITEELTTYIAWFASFNIVFGINLIFVTLLRATGDVINPLILTFLTAIANVAFAIIFTHGYFGLPAMGVKGVAIGSGLGTLIVQALYLIPLLRGKFALTPRFRRAFDMDLIRPLFRVGYPSAIEQGIVQVGFLGFMRLMAQYGTEAYAAYGIAVNILAVCIVVGVGFGGAGAILAGQHLGAGSPEKARESGWRALKLSLVVMSVIAFFMVIFAETLASGLASDPETLRLTVAFMLTLAAIQPLMAVEFSLGFALRGAGDTRFPLYVTVATMITIRIGLATFLYSLGLPVEIVFAAMFAEYALKALLLIWRYRSDSWLNIQDVHTRPARS